MLLDYKKGVLTITPDAGDEKDMLDFIFASPTGGEMVKVHLGDLLRQRKVQKDHNEMEDVFALITPAEKRAILTRKGK